MGVARKKIMFVCTRDAIMTNALMNKIRLRGGDPFPVHNARELEASAAEPAASVVYYMNDDVGDCAPLHAALDAYCAQNGVKVSCIGAKEQYDILREQFSPAHICDFFERPLNMEQFLERVVGEPDAATRKKRLLVVDDDANYREFVCGWLKDAYELLSANGGEQALKLLSTQNCDLVLLDYEMPVLSGPATMERINALPEMQRPPVLFLTGNADASCVDRVRGLRSAGYLLKTVRREELLAKIAEILA